MKKTIGTVLLLQKGLLVAILASFMTGCASTPRKIYTGEPLPKSEIARISIQAKKSSFGDVMLKAPAPRLYITHVNKQPVGSFWSMHGSTANVVDVLPGKHSIGVSSIAGKGALDIAIEKNATRQASGYGKVLELNARAGHEYIIKYIERRFPLIAWIEEVATGAVVSGEKPHISK